MPAPDPIAEAEVLLAYGRTASAIDLLKAASLREPGRLDIQARLEGMMAGRSRPGNLQESRRNRIPIAVHALVAWVLWACGMALPGYFLFRFAVSFAVNHALRDSPGLSLLAIFSGIVLFAVLTVAAGLTLFSLMWIAYLARVESVDAIEGVEAKLQGVIALRRMDPIYSWVKRSVYGLR